MSGPTDENLDERGDADDDMTQQELDAAASPPVRHRGDGVLSRLYHGETRVDIVGRWKIWFALSALVIGVGVVGLVQKGLNLGIDFTGGTVWEVPAGKADLDDVTAAMERLGYDDTQVQEFTQASGDAADDRYLRVEAEATAEPAERTTSMLRTVDRELAALQRDAPSSARDRVQLVRDLLDGIEGPFRQAVPAPLAEIRELINTAESRMKATESRAEQARAVRGEAGRMLDQVDELDTLEAEERTRLGQEVSRELAELTGSPVSQVTVDTVGPSWGKQVSEKARNALVVFLIAILLYITVRFEFRMAVATVVAFVHDIFVVVGVYALFAFPVTPATVIAILTILGFSIYDGIVVFDRVDENTRTLGKRAKMTYAEMANASLNQVLMRSLNTSITAALPVLSILLIGAKLLGEATLEEFGLALLIGVLSGAYSSLFIATPLLALLKERTAKYRALRERVLAARAQDLSAAGAGGPVVHPATDDAVLVAPPGAAPRPRKQGKRR